MARPKTKELKEKFTFRVYYDDERNKIQKVIDRYRDNFNSLNDTLKFVILVGCDKLIGDNELNQSINFSEIRRYMKSVDERLENIEGNQKLNFAENQAEIIANQKLINLNTNILTKATEINLRSYTPEWKYTPTDEYELETIKTATKREILNGR